MFRNLSITRCLCAILLTVSVLVAGRVSAQELEILRFEMAPMDLTAATHAVKDFNGQDCALIKVQVPRQGVGFEGNIVRQEFHINEYWVYVIPGTKLLQIKHPDAFPRMVEFAAYDIPAVESAVTYVMQIMAPHIQTAVTQDEIVSDERGISDDGIHFPEGYGSPSMIHYWRPGENPSESYGQYLHPIIQQADSLQGIGQYDKAVNLYNRFPHDPHALLMRGLCYLEGGNGLTQNTQLARQYISSAALTDTPAGKMAQSEMMANSWGVRNDKKQRFQLLKEAAEAGLPIAQFKLANAYAWGGGCKRDVFEAERWMTMSFDNGYYLSGVWLGKYYEGSSAGLTTAIVSPLKRDYAKSTEWYSRAMDKGCVLANFYLGMLYFDGKGVEKDYLKAYTLLKTAYNNGILPARKPMEKAKKKCRNL